MSLSDLLGDLLIALFNFQWQIHEESSAVCPAGIFESGSVLLNQNVNGCVRIYV